MTGATGASITNRSSANELIEIHSAGLTSFSRSAPGFGRTITVAAIGSVSRACIGYHRLRQERVGSAIIMMSCWSTFGTAKLSTRSMTFSGENMNVRDIGWRPQDFNLEQTTRAASIGGSSRWTAVSSGHIDVNFRGRRY